MDDDWYEREQLRFAAVAGDLDRAKQLVFEGYDVNAFDDGMRYTPLHCSEGQGFRRLPIPSFGRRRCECA